jgi:hypothetical protein
MDTELRTYIITELGLDRVSESAQDQTIEMIGELIVKELLLSVYESCSTETIKALDDCVEKEDMDALLAYIDEHIPNSEELFMNASQKIVGAYKEKIAHLQTKTT